MRKTYSTTYDEAGRVASVGDGSYDFDYTYSIFGLLTSTTQDLTGLSDNVVFGYSYDALGRKREVTTEIGTTDDYVNTYAYDNLGRVTQITQAGVTGGTDVAEKRVDFGYSDDNTRATISRFANLAGTKSVADTDRVFDALGRVTDIVHERAATEFADYDLTWNAGSQLTAFDFASLVGNDGDADYTYDDTSQLTDANYDFQTDEAYTYDDNGNRTITGYTTGDHNRLTSDGTYNYVYDDEGNVTSKTNISTSESVVYTWDHRNRLTKVTFKNSSGTPTEIVEYAYDHGQRWVRKTLDSNADSTVDESRIFVHDAGQIVLDFEKTGTGDAANSDLSHRYLWGAAVDQILSDESVDDGTADDVAWALTDHLNSVRDLVEYNPTTDTTSVIKHVTYDAFGNVESDTATGVESLLLFTARPYDEDGELQNNLNRWYDLSSGRWMSLDPIGFRGRDANLYRYVGNSTTVLSDTLGLKSVPSPWITLHDFHKIYQRGVHKKVEYYRLVSLITKPYIDMCCDDESPYAKVRVRREVLYLAQIDWLFNVKKRLLFNFSASEKPYFSIEFQITNQFKFNHLPPVNDRTEEVIGIKCLKDEVAAELAQLFDADSRPKIAEISDAAERADVLFEQVGALERIAQDLQRLIDAKADVSDVIDKATAIRDGLEEGDFGKLIDAIEEFD